MGDGAGRALLAIVTAVIGLAIVSVVLSNQAQTGTIISDSGQALSSVIGAATAPITGASSSANVGSDVNTVLGALGGGSIF
jgi:hypothetical protein